jgi:hypothetical protein
MDWSFALMGLISNTLFPSFTGMNGKQWNSQCHCQQFTRFLVSFNLDVPVVGDKVVGNVINEFFRDAPVSTLVTTTNEVYRRREVTRNNKTPF